MSSAVEHSTRAEEHFMSAALEEFFAAAGLKPKESKLYAAKCDSEGYDADTLASATVDELIKDLDMKIVHARTVHRHCMAGSDSGSGT